MTLNEDITTAERLKKKLAVPFEPKYTEMMKKEKNFSHLSSNLTLNDGALRPTKKIYTEKLYESSLNPVKEYIQKPFKKVMPQSGENPIVGECKNMPKKGKRIVCTEKPKSANPVVLSPGAKARKEAITKNIFSNVFEKKDDPLAVGIPRKKQSEVVRDPVAKDIINYKGGPVYPPEQGIQSKVTSAKMSEYRQMRGELIEQYKAEKSAYEVNRMKNCHSNWQGSKFQ